MKVIFLILIIILTIILVIIRLKNCNNSNIVGGAKQSNYGNIVVDTLNLTNYLYKEVSTEKIMNTIKYMTPILKQEYSDRIMFVVKDRTQFGGISDENKAKYFEICKELRIYIYIIEQYEESEFKTHSSMGRDDFYEIVLANKYNCSIISYDQMKDFRRFSKEVKPFKILEFSFWNKKPHKDNVNPKGFRLRKPKILEFKQ
jgi:hypothetical protein